VAREQCEKEGNKKKQIDQKISFVFLSLSLFSLPLSRLYCVPMSFLDRVLHKHKAKSTAELVSRAVTALDKLEVFEDGAGGGGGPSSASGGGGIDHDKSREDVARALSAMKVRLFFLL
jgi:hypothetical protein